MKIEEKRDAPCVCISRVYVHRRIPIDLIARPDKERELGKGKKAGTARKGVQGAKVTVGQARMDGILPRCEKRVLFSVILQRTGGRK